MDWLSRLNQSVDYIEQNLAGEISFHEAARIACCSTYHYQRMFSYIAGVPLSEYIRRRRMTAAAFELQCSDIKVLDAALKYGYESPTSFTRAFQQVHGLPPSAAREQGVQLKAYPRMTFTISIKGDTEMNYKIITKEAFRIVGARVKLRFDVEQNFQQVPQFWGQCYQEGMVERIGALVNQPPFGVMGVSTCMDGEDYYYYYIAAPTDKEVPDGMYSYEVPAATWAVFDCTGPMPQSMQELQRRIVTEWLPSSGYDYAQAPDIEVYPEGDPSVPGYTTQVWMPVVKKDA
ncbi:AraC family transcriptional regulator [Candidatus Soleaferrea massiliensis]|uniref:AraC family transcriptional regulator n=1 Tax=Candidatus Soleaferrea massiliensis TaxID=1470354 RepID=UPI00058BC2AE|nr:AraC family transcriptional regulator [Candidatus Soleaferrea massiliensis]